MADYDNLNCNDILGSKIGKKVFLKRKSAPDYLIVGVLSNIVGSKLIISSYNDTFVVEFEDIFSLDVKSKDGATDKRWTLDKYQVP